MSNWKNLPAEILVIVFRYCNSIAGKKSIRQCALTCQSWKRPSYNILFSTIETNSQEQFDKLAHFMIKRKALAKIVKSLKVHGKKLDLFSFLGIAKLFVNLQELVFSSPRLDFYYAVSNKEFPCIRVLPVPDTPLETEEYSKCLEIQKHNLTTVTLNDFGTYELWHSKLNAFPNLEAISIIILESTATKFIMDPIEMLFQKSNPQSVKTVSLKLYRQPGSLEMLTKLDTVQPVLSVECLNIVTILASSNIVDDTFMLYILKKFPNLQSFNLECRGLLTSFAKDHPTVSVNITVQFLKYLRKMRRCKLYFSIVTGENTGTIIERLCTATNYKKDDSLKFECLRIKYFDTASQNLMNRKTVINLNSLDSMMEDRRNMNVQLWPSLDPQPSEDIEILKQTGHHFEKIVIEPEDRRTERIVCHLLLGAIGRYCTRLNKLTIIYCSSLPSPLSREGMIPNYNLKELVLKYCDSPIESFHLISYLFPKLEVMTIANRIYREDYSFYYTKIDIPTSMSLNSLQIELGHCFRDGPLCFKGVCLQLIMGKKTKYFLLSFVADKFSGCSTFIHRVDDIKQIETSSNAYKALMDNKQFTTCRIYCNPLKKFSVRCTQPLGFNQTKEFDF